MGCCSSTVPSASHEVFDRFLANVDVWQTIFEVLSVKDRIRLEMTNKRLHMLMLEYWKRVTLFDDMKCDREMRFSSWMEGHRRWSYVSCTGWNSDKLWAAFVSICVNRIGDGLRSLTIRERSTHTGSCWGVNLPSISEGCPNIETINFVIDGKDGTLDIHFDSFSRLKTLTVSGARGGFIAASASVFLSIPVSIEVIRGLEGNWKEPFENAAQIEGFFADRPSLREVDLGELYTDDKSNAIVFRVIAERCPHLKSIKLSHTSSNCIDYSGVIALESMKQLRIRDAGFDEIEIVTICERSLLIEALELRCRFSSNIDLQSAALNALGALTKLRELSILAYYGDVVAPSLVIEFVRELARNSGASLRRLYLDRKMPLPTAAIEALANGCAKLRDGECCVRVGEATPASIRFLIDSIVAHPSWIHQTGERILVIDIVVICDGRVEYTAGLAAFKALAAPAANLPSDVQLKIC